MLFSSSNPAFIGIDEKGYSRPRNVGFLSIHPPRLVFSLVNFRRMVNHHTLRPRGHVHPPSDVKLDNVNVKSPQQIVPTTIVISSYSEF